MAKTELVVDMRDFEYFIEDLQKGGVFEQAMIETCYQVANEWMAKVVKRTPSKKKHTSGQMKRSWEVTEVKKVGNVYKISVFNSAISEEGYPYPGAVEFGHRIVDKGKKTVGWVPGQFMVTISAQEMEDRISKIAEKKIKEAWEELG